MNEYMYTVMEWGGKTWFAVEIRPQKRTLTEIFNKKSESESES